MENRRFNSADFKFQKIESPSDKTLGALTPIECPGQIPFDIQRIYYIYGVGEDKTRGFHAHKKLHQILICVHGSVDIYLENFYGSQKFTLQDPSEGLYVGPDNWREMSNFKDDAVLLVLASEKYDPNDYIRDHDEFLEYSRKKYGGR